MSVKPDHGLIAIFLFYNVSNGIQSFLAFDQNLKHCDTIIYDGKDWILLAMDTTGLNMRRIKCPSGVQLLQRLPLMPELSGLISVHVESRHKVLWKPLWTRSCNEVCRYTAGIDIGFTFNPRHLWSKILKYNGKRNYQVLSAWRREDGIQQWGIARRSGG